MVEEAVPRTPKVSKRVEERRSKDIKDMEEVYWFFRRYMEAEDMDRFFWKIRELRGDKKIEKFIGKLYACHWCYEISKRFSRKRKKEEGPGFIVK